MHSKDKGELAEVLYCCTKPDVEVSVLRPHTELAGTELKHDVAAAIQMVR